METAELLPAFVKILLMVAGCVGAGICAGYPAVHWIGRKFAKLLSCLPTEKFSKAPLHAPEYGENVLQRGLQNLTSEFERTAILKLSEALKSVDFRPFKYPDHAQVTVAG